MQIVINDSELQRQFLEVCRETLAKLKELEPDHDIMTQKEILKKFDISYLTLKQWEKHGLKRLVAPYQSSKVYYRYSQIISFLEGN